jgi:hypothetical protein
MGDISRIDLPGQTNVSPLVLCDRLISLAQEADRGGFVIAAEHLLDLASEVLDWPSGPGGWSH